MAGQQGFSGFELADLEVSKGDQWDVASPGVALPDLYWLQIIGEAGFSDFGLDVKHYLVVSQRVKKWLEGNGFDKYVIWETWKATSE